MNFGYTNPIIPGFRSDPSICRAGDDFFLVNTSFEYFPGLPVFQSRDLVNWRQIGHVLDRPSQLDMTDVWVPSGGIYGSTIRHHQGGFYVVTSVLTTGPARHCIVTTDNPFGGSIEGTWSLAERPGWLTLRGNAQDLDSYHSPVWVGRRQCAHVCTVETLLEFSPQHDGEEAGLTVFQNYTHHCEVALRRADGRNKVILRRRIGSLQKIEHVVDWPQTRVRLRIAADERNYGFACAPAESDWIELGQGECRYLSTEVGGRFTGVYFALYATSPGRDAVTPAHFDWLDYRENPK